MGILQYACSMFRISTWQLYMLQVLVHGLYIKCIICMLQMWVHCAGIICTIACYGMLHYFGLWLSTWNILLSHLSFETWYCSYVSFQLNLFFLVSVEFNFSRNLRLVLGTWNLHWNLNFRLRLLLEPTYMGFVDCSWSI